MMVLKSFFESSGGLRPATRTERPDLPGASVMTTRSRTSKSAHFSYPPIHALEAVIHTRSLDVRERLRDPAFANEVTELFVRYFERRPGE